MKRAEMVFKMHFPFLLVLLAPWPGHGQEETPFTRLFDTGVAATAPLAEEVIIQKPRWRLVPEDKIDQEFAGDAVMLNDKLALVLRKTGSGAEIYSRAAGGLKFRASLSPGGAPSSPSPSPATVQIIENNSGVVMLEATFQHGGPVKLRYRLTTGEAILEIVPGPGAGSVEVRTQARYLVVPDYFGDDMVFGVGSGFDSPMKSRATTGSDLTIGLPAENYCLHLLEGGDAILMSVWQSNQQEVWLTKRGADQSTNAGFATIQCLPGKSIWLAFLESAGFWRASSAAELSGWQPPFPAKWRCSYVRQHGLADSWDQDSGPTPDQSAGPHSGPLLVYPLDRSAATPLTVLCPTDVMRNTLGVGPCQYILACEGLDGQGTPTPDSVMGWVERQFERKKQKQAAEDIQERLDQMIRHVGDARARIERYAEFTARLRQRLGAASERGSGPWAPILEDLDRFIAAGLAPAAAPERAQQLSTQVAALIGKENALAACRQLGEQLRSLGSVQDGTLARCRMAVRRLKQLSLALLKEPPPEGDRARDVRLAAEQMLRGKSARSENGGGFVP